MTEISCAGEIKGITLPKTVDIPLTPPVEKPFGILKKYTPIVVRTTPIVIMANVFSFSFIESPCLT